MSKHFEIDLKKSGIILLRLKSPPPITFPALADTFFNFFDWE